MEASQDKRRGFSDIVFRLLAVAIIAAVICVSCDRHLRSNDGERSPAQAAPKDSAVPAVEVPAVEESVVESTALPIISVGFRRGFANSLVLQVDNLSSVQGVEIGVRTLNGEKVFDSRRIVIPSGKQREFGVLELGWNFKVGDRGCVFVAGHAVRAYFCLVESGRFAVRYISQALDDEKVRKLDFTSYARPL